MDLATPTPTLHQIGAVADRTGLSLRTIRHYEDVGLVTPTGRSSGGFRLYTDADVELLERVKVMKPLGFSLEETSEILELQAAVRSGRSSEQDTSRLAEFAARSVAQCSRLGEQLDRARSFTMSLSSDLERAARSS